jgi:hypothetical protein
MLLFVFDHASTIGPAEVGVCKRFQNGACLRVWAFGRITRPVQMLEVLTVVRNVCGAAGELDVIGDDSGHNGRGLRGANRKTG